MEAQTPEFQTSDLYFAAYLQVAGVKLQRSDRNPQGRYTFYFDTSIVGNIDSLKHAWFSQTGKVAALPFANAIKALKAVVHM